MSDIAFQIGVIPAGILGIITESHPKRTELPEIFLYLIKNFIVKNGDRLKKEKLLLLCDLLQLLCLLIKACKRLLKNHIFPVKQRFLRIRIMRFIDQTDIDRVSLRLLQQLLIIRVNLRNLIFSGKGFRLPTAVRPRKNRGNLNTFHRRRREQRISDDFSCTNKCKLHRVLLMIFIYSMMRKFTPVK